MSYQHILTAVDIQAENAHHLLLRSQEIAQCFSAQLHIAYVSGGINDQHDTEIYIGEQGYEIVDSHNKKRCREEMNTALNGINISSDNIHILNGPIDLAVIALAEDISANLIITAKSHALFHFLNDHSLSIDKSAKCDTLSLYE